MRKRNGTRNEERGRALDVPARRTLTASSSFPRSSFALEDFAPVFLLPRADRRVELVGVERGGLVRIAGARLLVCLSIRGTSGRCRALFSSLLGAAAPAIGRASSSFLGHEILRYL